MIRPRLPKLASGTRLTTDLVNGIINRTEYAADLLRQYKLTAGNGMYVEPHYDGTRVSYLQPVAGGATPTRPIIPLSDGSDPENPATIDGLFALYGDTAASGERYINLESHDDNFGIYINSTNYVSPQNGVLFRFSKRFSVQFILGYGIPANFNSILQVYELRITQNPGPNEIIGIAFNLDQALAIQGWGGG